MTHYICKGDCKGVSEDFGFCEAENCNKFAEPLEECECEDGKHFSEDSGTNGIMVKDSNGNVLMNGDSVLVIKDLDVKGSSMNIKRGDKLKNIRIIDDPENVECKMGKSTIVIKTCYIKKV